MKGVIFMIIEVTVLQLIAIAMVGIPVGILIGLGFKEENK